MSNIFDFADTWNNGAIVFKGIKLNVSNGAGGAPVFAAGSLLLDLQSNGVSQFNVGPTGLISVVANGYTKWVIDAQNTANQIGFSANGAAVFGAVNGGGFYAGQYGYQFGASIVGTPEFSLIRDAANTLALRNGTAAQTFNIYSTYTDGLNYTRASLDWITNAGTLTLSTTKAGTGTAAPIRLDSSSGIYNFAGNGDHRWYNNGTLTWRMDSTTNALITFTDNAYDIGASGANRPRDIYLARNLLVGSNITSSSIYALASIYVGSGQYAGFNSSADGILQLTNGAGNGFGRIQFGDTTASSPALKKSGPALGFRRANDTIGVFADLPAAAAGNEGSVYPISDSTTATWGATITGGGANHVLAYSNGTNWTVAAK